MKKKAGKKTYKKSLIAVTLVVTFGVIIVLGIYQHRLLPQAQPTQKFQAAEYFEIVDATVDNANPKFNSTGALVAWEMYALRYTLKAVKGDAHDVVIKSWAQAQPVYFDVIQKGGNVTVTQTSTQTAPYLLEVQNVDGKFKFTVNLRSAEAEGKIDIWL